MAVEDAINKLVDLYNIEGSGKPFPRTGTNTQGSNMSDYVGHSSSQKSNIDLLESWIIQEFELN